VAEDMASAELLTLTSSPVPLYNRVASAFLPEWALLNIRTKLTAYRLGDKYFSSLYDAVC
jgi:hypothetical protein